MTELRPDLGAFKGQRLLILEESYFLSDEIRSVFRRLGTVLLGPVATAKAALEILDSEEVDAVILDLDLPVEDVVLLADRLDSLDIPYLFARNEDPAAPGDGVPGFVFCDRPGRLEEIARALFGQRRMNG